MLSLDEVLKQNKARKAALAQGRVAAQENQGPSSESTGNRGPGVVSGGSPVTLEREVWNEVFQGEQFELPDTEFMKRHQELLPD